MSKPRLSMKLLWELRGDFCLESTKGMTESQAHAMEYTRRFLIFVDDRLRSLKVK